MRCVVDTSALLGLLLQADQYHRRAREFFRTKNLRLFTNTVIVAELYTHLRYEYGPQAAFAGRERVTSDPIFEIAEWGFPEDAMTYEMLRRFTGISLSYADASLLVLADRLHVREIASFDSDFRLAGFNVVPG